MKKKGFTLIELLAVIVILAIIALITTPIVLGIIKNAKKGAAEDSMLYYVKGIEQGYMNLLLNDSTVDTSKYKGAFAIDDKGLISKIDAQTKLAVPLNGNGPQLVTSNYVNLSQSGQTQNGCLKFDGYYVYYNSGKVGSSEKSCTEAEEDMYNGSGDQTQSCTYANLYLRVDQYEKREDLPEKSQENRIAVITDKMISGYQVSLKEPISLEEGKVWIVNGDSGDNSNSVLTGKDSVIPIIQCSQYQGVGFETKPCYIYHDGDWHLISSSFSGDTEPPKIIFDQASITLTIDQVTAGYDFLKGVTVEDNVSVPENIRLRIIQSTVSTLPGTYSVVYGATDEAGNMAINVRTVVVEDNTYQITVNKTAGGTIDIPTSAKSGTIVNFKSTITTDNFDTYVYQGITIKSFSGQVLQTLPVAQTAFEMPKMNIVIEPNFKLEKSYLIKAGVANTKRLLDYSRNSVSRTESWDSWNSEDWNPHGSATASQNVGNIDMTGVTSIYVEGSVGVNDWATAQGTTVLGGTTLISAGAGYSKLTPTSMSGVKTLTITVRWSGNSACAFCTNTRTGTHSLTNIYVTY